MFFNALRMPVTYLYYELDPDGFIALLCENKDTPELECEGKCELKKVAESSTNNSKEPAKVYKLLYLIDVFGSMDEL